MMAALGVWGLGVLQKWGIYLLLGGAVVVTVLLVLARVKNAGVLQERVEVLQRTVNQVKVKAQVEREIQQDLHATGQSASDRLHRDWQRD